MIVIEPRACPEWTIEMRSNLVGQSHGKAMAVLTPNTNGALRVQDWPSLAEAFGEATPSRTIELIVRARFLKERQERLRPLGILG